MFPKLPTAQQNSDFQRIFGVRLRTFWDNFTGFDVIKFDELIQPADGQSTQDKVREDYGEDAVQLCLELIGKPDETAGETPVVYNKRRPNGGYKVHLCRVGEYTALCGFKPSSPNAHRMSPRGRWIAVDLLNQYAKEFGEKPLDLL